MLQSQYFLYRACRQTSFLVKNDRNDPNIVRCLSRFYHFFFHVRFRACLSSSFGHTATMVRPSGRNLNSCQWNNPYRFLQVVRHGFKETLECDLELSPVFGAFSLFGKLAFKRHADARAPSVKILVFVHNLATVWHNLHFPALHFVN